MPLIEMQNVSKAYWSDRAKTKLQLVLDDASLSIEEGEFVCLLGPSGCGKTVSLNLIAGFEQPASGAMRFRGKPIEAPGPERGVVFQEYSLMPWLSVAGNLLFALESCGVPRGERRRRVAEALRAVGLEACADMRPNLLSGGQKQRVAIARVLAMDSEVFLMDEPFSALDEQTRGTLDTELRELWLQRHETIVFVTHSIREAVTLASRVVLYSASPGRVLREWLVPENMDRKPTSEAARVLCEEIHALMPVSMGG